MSVRKTYGFGNSSPYRSETFNFGNSLIFGRNGPLSIGRIFNDGANVVITDVTFVQQGVMVQNIGTATVTFPTLLQAPFYLTASIPDTRPVDNISWSFVRRPQDISSNLALIAEWDGSEWRSLDKLSIAEIVKNRLSRAKAYGNLGFNTGFRFSPAPDFSTYTLSAGQITDKTGQLITKEEPTTFTAIPQDPDFSRIDVLFWRRLNDSPNRIGLPLLRPWGTYNSGTLSKIKELTVVGSSAIHAKQQILNLADNTYLLFYIENYGTNGVLKATKYNVARTGQLIAPVTLATNVLDFSTILDINGDITIVFTQDGNLFRMKVDPSLATILSAADIDSLVNPIKEPVARHDYLGNTHIMFLYQLGPTTYTPYYMRINVGGTVSVTPKPLINSTDNYGKVDFAVNLDLVLHAAFLNATNGFVEYQTFDDIGVGIGSKVRISDDTKYGVSVLASVSRNPKIRISENNEVYVSWEQNKGSNLYGLAIYNPNYKAFFGRKALIQNIESGTENISAHSISVDWGNHAHILVSHATKTLYYQLYLPSFGSRLTSAFQVAATSSTHLGVVYDKYGSLILSWTPSPVGVTNNGSPITGLFVGQGNYGSESVFIGAAEIAVKLSDLNALTPVPTIGDQFVLSLSTSGNSGTYIIDNQRDITLNSETYRVLRASTNFNAAESGTSLAAQFTYKNGNALMVAKQTAAISYNYSEVKSEELDTDNFAVQIKRPGNQYQTWYDTSNVVAGSTVLRGENFLACGGHIVWQKNVSGGQLAWSEDIRIVDPFRGLYEIPAGNITNLAEDDTLYVLLPETQYFLKDGNTDGSNTATVTSVSDFYVGQKVFIGDADSTGIVTTVSSLSAGLVQVATSLAAFTKVRGAYIIPLTLTLKKEKRNEGDLRPSSLGEVNSNVYAIAYRKNDLIMFRDGNLTLRDEESGQIGDGVSDNLLAYLDASTDAPPLPVFGVPTILQDSTYGLRVAISTLAQLFADGGIKGVVWVSKTTGNDTTGAGSFYKPYATLKKALDSITTASSSNKFAVVMAPGLYEEPNDIAFKPWVGVYGLTKETVRLKRLFGLGPGYETMEVDLSTSGNVEFVNILFEEGLSIHRDAASSGSTHVEMSFCKILSGDFVFDGLGGGQDSLTLRNSEISGETFLHAVKVDAYNSLFEDDIWADDSGWETPELSGPAATMTFQGCTIQDITTDSTSRDVLLRLLSTRILGEVTINDNGSPNPPAVEADAISLPQDESNLILSNDALLTRLTYAYGVAYVPAYPSNWPLGEPKNVKDALDLLAQAVKDLQDSVPEEETYVVTDPSGITEYEASDLTWDPDIANLDIKVYLNGRKLIQDPLGGSAQDFFKIDGQTIGFSFVVPQNAKIHIRREGSVGSSSGGGNLWSDEVDADIIPDGDNTRDLGSSSRRFKDGYFAGKLTVIGGIDPAYMQLTPQEETDGIPNNSLWIDPSDDFKLKLKNNSGTDIPLNEVSATSVFEKQMQSGHNETMAANIPVSKLPNGKIVPADSDSVNGQKFCGILKESVPVDGMGRVRLMGQNCPGALTGYEFTPGDDVYISQTGAYTNDPGSFSDGDDSIIRVGMADCAAGAASDVVADLIMWSEVLLRPAL